MNLSKLSTHSAGVRRILGLVSIMVLSAYPMVHADDDQGKNADAMMQAASLDAGKISPTEKKLYEQSIRSTKGTLSRDTLEVFYHDAMDYYRERRYDDALELLDKIYSIDPGFEDVAMMRDTVRRVQSNQSVQSTRHIVDDYMQQGNVAFERGQNVVAINFWKQALTVNPSYEPAKKRIHEVNHGLAQKQFEQGYLYYHHGDMEDALDSWSNAIALDPTFKQRGLLLLMSKVELSVHQDQANRLSMQGYDQYSHGDLAGALQTYTDLLILAPRNEDARHMAAKIKIQLGEAAFKEARAALSRRYYAEAIRKWETSIKYGFEVVRSKQGIEETERLIQAEHRPKPPKPSKPVSTGVASSTVTTPSAATAPAAAAPAAPAQPANPAEAQVHYRQGLGAMRAKDYHRALEELDIAAQLDPTDEHIYVARERAKQEWNSANAGRGAP